MAQLWTVIWEHCKIRKRHYVLTLLELCIPIIIFVLVAFGRSQLPSFNKEFIPVTKNYITPDSELSHINIVDTKLFYSPKTAFTADLARQVQLKLYMFNENIKGFDSKEDVLRYYNEMGGDGITAIINFDDVDQKIPTTLKYDIQMYEEGIDWETEKLFRKDIRYYPGYGSSHYLGNQFLSFQWALDTAYIEMLTKSPLNITINFEEFPYPAHWTDNGMNDMFVHLLPLLTMLSFIFLFPAILKMIVEEKSSGMKQLMKINGLKSSIYWLGWFLNASIPCIISAIVVAILLTQRLFSAEYPSLQHASMPQLALLILLYCLATISFIFAFSIFFKDATLAMITGITVWFLIYIIYASTVGNVDTLPLYLKYFASLIPTIALYNGFQVISVAEIRASPVGFTEQPRGCSDDMTMQTTFIMLIIDTLLYLTIAICCETDPHGKYKIANFCRKVKNKIDKFKKSDNTGVNNEEEHLIGIEDPNDEVLLEIKNLTKKYNDLVAVNKLNMKIYKDNLTVILGHNGAGKTTTLSILAGLEKETSGELTIAEIENVNLKDRQLVSICPQENMLFTELTVEEHLVLFGKLKGLSDEDIKQNVKNLLENKLNLANKKDDLVKNLSGGMKRKLSIGIAIMGTPKVVILDEPTAGIDPEGRREIWDLILECKKDSNIILSTHLMEEAEELADRVAILGNGTLERYGKPMDLKQKLGVGYRIQLFYEDPTKEKVIKTFVEENIDAKINPDNNKLVLEFCITPEKKCMIPKFKEVLNSRKGELSIKDYKISSVTLEDVFLRSLENHDREIRLTINRQESINSQGTHKNLTCFPNNLWHKFVLIAEKKMKILRAMPIPWITMIALFYSLFALSFAMNDSGHKHTDRDGKTLQLNLDSYGCTKVFYEMKNDDANLERIFVDLIDSTISNSHRVDDISEAVISVGENNIVKYRQKLIVGAKMNFDESSREITVFYGSQPIHGAPISFNLLSNVLAKYLVGENHEIIASHTPLRSVKSTTRQTNVYVADYIISWMILLSNACLFSVIMFSALPTLEKNSFIKTLSRIYNLNSICYWLHNYITDVIIYLVMIIPPIAVLGVVSKLDWALLQIDGYCYLVIILIWYGITMIPHTYLSSFYSKSVSNAIALLLIPNMLSSIPVGVILSLQSSGSVAPQIFLYLFALLDPHIILTYTLSIFCDKMIKNHNWDMKTPSQKEYICNETPLPCCDPDSVECAEDRAYIQYPIYLMISVVSALIVMFIIVWLDKEKSYKKNHEEGVTIGAKEVQKHYNIRTLRSFKKTTVKAVDDLSFRVSKGECYGLLGVNGAGKSTSFKILTNQVRPDKGEIFRRQNSLIGYCPQEHALLNFFTGRELLKYFGKLRNPSIHEDEIDDLLNKCGLNEYSNKPCGTYSGGNKRKLNTCIALIGHPDIITLDEPTTGVDPQNRRKIKELINETKLNKKSAIIFTSHSMDECELLCDKLSIMKAGKLETDANLSVPELKEKYNIGHIIQMKVKSPQQIDTILEALRESFNNVIIEKIAARNNLLTVSIKNSNWGSIISGMESMKTHRNEIVDYMVKESSLEEVFLKVAKG
ncbi:phospholipid-transporting ATPase ABCA3-like [Onthophagus taurus]|uniref:phospholipid-transporting ATPase ABCA3-like n=1 Tax=Onthophagus taurus TaxID=166361 RepID=UPI0039BE619E